MERLMKVGQIDLSKNRNTRASRLGIGFEKLDRGVFDPEIAYDHVANIGLHWVRIQSGWRRTEQQKGVYDFAWLDSIVDNLIQRDLEPWLCLCYGNPLYTPHAEAVFGSMGCPPVETEEERNAWDAYVRAVVERYKGRIRWYEVWNEPDLAYSWRHSWDADKHAANPYEYADFCRATACAVHETDPEAKVVGFAVAHAYNLTFLSRALGHGLAEHLDAVSFHIYAIDDTLRPGFIKTMRALLDAYNPRIELIQGEAGGQSRPDGLGAMHGFGWTPEKQVKYLLRGTVHDLHSGVKFSSYFTTVDMAEATHGVVGNIKSRADHGFFGVLGAEFDEDEMATGRYARKPAFTALQTLCAVFREDFSPTDLPLRRMVKPSRWVHDTDCNDRTVITYGFTRPNGSSALVYWNSTPVLASAYFGTISFEAVAMDTAHIRLVDLSNGNIYAIPEKMIVDKGDGCVELINLPLTDAPLLLTFGDFLPR